MNKKILLCLLSLSFVLSLAGCKKGNETNNEEVDDSKAKIYCTKTTEYTADQMSIETVVNSKVNDDNYVYWDEFVTIETFGLDEDYKSRKKFLEETNTTASDGSITTYTYDDANRKITGVISSYVDFDQIPETHKQYFKVAAYVKNEESNGYKCEVSGASKQELGM